MLFIHLEPTAMQDRLRGTLISLAVGDALEQPVGFRPPGTFEWVVCYRSGGPHGLGPGEWTDDTSTAPCSPTESVHRGVDLHDQLHRYLGVVARGEYSVNRPVLRHRHRHPLGPGGSPSMGDRRKWLIPPNHRAETARSCGCAVPIRYAGLFRRPWRNSRGPATESSLTTHASEQCPIGMPLPDARLGRLAARAGPPGGTRAGLAAARPT